MLAVKHMDPIMGVDIHIVMVPTPGGPVPVPIPHPFIGMVFDALDWIPITIMVPSSVAAGLGKAMGAVESGMNAAGIDLGAQSINNPSGQASGGGSGTGMMRVGMSAAAAGNNESSADSESPPPTEVNPDNFKIGSSAPDAVPIPLNASVWVNGIPRGHAGTMGRGPNHFPIGGPAFQRPPVMSKNSQAELLLGSKTVLADASPMTYMGLMALSCTCIGSPPPPRPGKDPEAGFFLPVSVVMAIPAGKMVLVGGPPIVNFFALAFKLPGALRKLHEGIE